MVQLPPFDAAPLLLQILALFATAVPIVWLGGLAYSFITGAPIQLGLFKIYSVVIRAPGGWRGGWWGPPACWGPLPARGAVEQRLVSSQGQQDRTDIGWSNQVLVEQVARAARSPCLPARLHARLPALVLVDLQGPRSRRRPACQQPPS